MDFGKRMARPLVALMVTLGLGAAGCGGDEEAADGSVAQPDTPSQDEESTGSAGGADAPDESEEAGEAQTVLATPSAEELPAAFRSEVLEVDGPVLVVFHAPNWNQASEDLDPVLSEIEEGQGLRVVTVNVDEQPEVTRAYLVPTVPLAAIFEDGVPTAVLRDGITPDALRQFAASAE